jgi:adenylosuccinate lyase
MISRYTLPEMGAIWNDISKYKNWLKVELAVCQALTDLGKISIKDNQQIQTKARFDLNRVAEIEKEVRHDVIAFLTNLAENVGPSAKYIHMGLTSSDIVDTGLSLQMVKASQVLEEQMAKLISLLKQKAIKYKKTVTIGRTHGIHAEPTTFGLKLLLWHLEMKRNLSRLQAARETIAVGKISGAVGNYANVDPKVEEIACQSLGLKPALASTQILQRDRHAQFLTTLAIIGSSLEKFATEIRSLQRTDILEVEEPFVSGQKGSSAMPHKRNPIICERISGLARVLRSNSLASMENISLWHERDISHSSVERIIIPDSCILLNYMLDSFSWVVGNLKVYPKNMLSNLEKTRGLIFSQQVLLSLVSKGASREEAYQIIQQNAMKSWQQKTSFLNNLADDKRIAKYLSKKELGDCFDLEYYLRQIDTIFNRLERQEKQ